MDTNLDKDTKVIKWRKDNLSNKWCYNDWISILKKKKKRTPWMHTSKCIIDLNVRPKTIQHLKETKEENLCDFVLIDNFFDMIQKKHIIHKRTN